MSLLLAHQSAGTTHNADLTETGAVSDSQTALAVFVGALTESGSAVDSQTGLATFAGVLSETLAASGTETATADFASVVSETSTIVDSQTGNADYPASLSETLSATDSQTGDISVPQTYNVTVDEAVAVTDSQDATVEVPYVPSGTTMGFAGLRKLRADRHERVFVRDRQTASLDAVAALSEELSPADQGSAAVDGIGITADLLEAADLSTVESLFDGAPTDRLIVLDDASGSVEFAGVLSESLGARDSLYCEVVRGYKPPTQWTPDQDQLDEEEVALAFLMMADGV